MQAQMNLSTEELHATLGKMNAVLEGSTMGKLMDLGSNLSWSWTADPGETMKLPFVIRWMRIGWFVARWLFVHPWSVLVFGLLQSWLPLPFYCIRALISVMIGLVVRMGLPTVRKRQFATDTSAVVDEEQPLVDMCSPTIPLRRNFAISLLPHSSGEPSYNGDYTNHPNLRSSATDADVNGKNWVFVGHSIASNLAPNASPGRRIIHIPLPSSSQDAIGGGGPSIRVRRRSRIGLCYPVGG
ncbi:hypothetical protein DL93DRAFT_1568100 [Clavulina sp. PMI_390]|nr:hypothetical protein DL93DRAFT_1568100 [Clavulina sp. PMI_390]